MSRSNKEKTHRHRAGAGPGGSGSGVKKLSVLPGKDLKHFASKMMKGSKVTMEHRATNRPDTLPGQTATRDDSARLVLEAEQKKKFFSMRESIQADATKALENGQRSVVNTCLKKYYQDFLEVVNVSDVLLEVLDARDPLACRLTRAEEEIRSKHNDRKKFILLLNKADLIPHEVALQWVEHFTLRGDRCILFSTKKRGMNSESIELAQRCVDELYRELRQIARNPATGLHRSLTVGVVGYPNVGKSSIINALKRKDVVKVANQAGSTKGLAEVDLRKNIKVVDCPGIVFDTNQCTEDLVLINAVRLEEVGDPIVILDRVVRRVGLDRLQEHYRVPFAPDITVFLQHLCRKQGRFMSGGALDEVEGARSVLRDWNNGLITFYAQPPAKSSLWTPDVLTSSDDIGTGETVLVDSSASGMGRCMPELVPDTVKGFDISEEVKYRRVKAIKRERLAESR